MITQRTLFNLIPNPRRGTRRFGGSTQAAARARRAPAPAAPAPKKAGVTKSKTTKATKTTKADGLLFSLLQAAPIRKDWLGTHYRGHADFEGVTRRIIVNSDLLLFVDSLSLTNQKKFSYQPDIDLNQFIGSVFFNFKDPLDLTDEIISKGRIVGAFVSGKKLKHLFGRTEDPIYIAFPTKRSGESHRGIELTTLKRLVTLTKADKIVFGPDGVMPVVLYRGGSIVAAMRAPFIQPSKFKQGDQVNDVLDQMNIKRNPRKGTRRFGGSTQAAARARRAPAPAAPAPTLASKKARATKPRTRKTVAGNSLFFKLLNAVPVKKNALIPEDIHSWGSVRVDDVQRFAMTDGISFVFLDSLEGDKKSAFKEYIERKSSSSRSQYNVEKGLFFVSNAIKSKVEITNENISRGRINGAFVERKRLKPTSSYRSGVIEFLFPPGVVGDDYQGFDLCRTKFLVKLTKANRIVVGYSGNTTNAPVLLYRDDLLVAFFNGTTGGQSAFRNGDQVNDILDQMNIKRNPRRGTRRFGGSTQAAARARRALALAAPAPAAAPKKTRARRAPAPAAPAAAPKRASVKRAPSATGVKGVLGDLLSKLPFRFDDWYVRGEYTKIWLADNFISDGAIVLYKHGMTAPNIAKFGKASDKQRAIEAQVLPQVGQDMYKEEKVLIKNKTRRAFQPLYFAASLYDKKKWFPIEAPIGLPVKSGKLKNGEKISYRVQSDNGQGFDFKLIKVIQNAVNFDHVEESTKGDPLLFFFKNDRLVALLIGLRNPKDNKWLPVSDVLSSLENQG